MPRRRAAAKPVPAATASRRLARADGARGGRGGRPPGQHSASRRSSDSARCAPRLPPASACTSSTMTVSTLRRTSRAAEVSSRNSDSGVVIRISGGWADSLRRSSAAVSPVRTPTRMSSGGRPRRSAAWPTPVSGERRLRSMSTASAFIGEMYSTRQRCRGSAGTGPVASLSIAHRNAASVLPDPVGAITSALSPRAIDAQACACTGVGAAKAAPNQARVASLKPFRAELMTGVDTGMYPSCLAPPTVRATPPAALFLIPEHGVRYARPMLRDQETLEPVRAPGWPPGPGPRPRRPRRGRR